ncbi:MAG TPA: tautomerase family protein [Azospirillum sp.]|nr:tautomerase family protein [Azospirillum sp.]
MPLVQIRLLEGRTPDQKEAMFAAVTEALCRTVDCQPGDVRIEAIDMARDQYAVGGTSIARRDRKAAGP